MRKTGWIVALLIAAMAVPAQAEKTHVGYVEKILLADVGLVVKAKMDTGAKTSSIDADVIDIVKIGEKTEHKPGEKVVFTIASEDAKEKKTFEREIQRYVRIKKKGGGYIRRPVIHMTFCVAGKKITEEVNLANRENFLYPVLIGRNMLSHADLVIDPSRSFMSRPNCEPEPQTDD